MVILGLGSNIDNRTFYLQQAIEMLAGTYGEKILSHVRLSSIYESKAVLPEDAPKEWDLPYLNMVIAGETKLSPHELLERIKRFEILLGRQTRGRWGPREIDIDILAYDDGIIKEKELIVPHKELLNRDFALVPLAELCPEWTFPVKGDYYQWKAEDIANEKGYKRSLTKTNLALVCDINNKD